MKSPISRAFCLVLAGVLAGQTLTRASAPILHAGRYANDFPWAAEALSSRSLSEQNGELFNQPRRLTFRRNHRDFEENQRNDLLPQEAALNTLRSLSRHRILGRLIALSRGELDQIKTMFYGAYYRPLLAGTDTTLDPERRAHWIGHLQRALGHPIVLVSGPTRRLIEFDGRAVHVNESLLSFSDIQDLTLRNRVLTWMLARAAATIWASEHAKNPIVLSLRYIARRAGFETARDQTEYLASLMGVLFPWQFYSRLWRIFSAVRAGPPASLSAIEERFHQTHPLDAEGLQLIQQAYTRAQKFYASNGTIRRFESGEAYFERATHMALSVAKMGRGAIDIAAALLHLAEPTQIQNLQSSPIRSDMDTREIIELIFGLRQLTAEPFKPRIVENEPDYQLQDFLNRNIQSIAQEARRIVDGRIVQSATRGRPLSAAYAQSLTTHLMGSLFSLLQADKLQTIASFPAGNPQELERLYAEIKLLHAPQAERLGQLEMAAALRDQAFKASEPEAYIETQNAFQAALQMTDDEADRLLSTVLHDAANKAIALGVTPITTRYRKKSLESGRQKLEEARHRQEASGEEVTAEIGDQRDLLAMMIVVKTPKDLAKIRDIYKQLGTTLDRKDKQAVRRIRQHGHTVYQLVDFEVPHPTLPDKKVTLELQILTQEAYADYLYGQNPVRYKEAHWRKNLARTATLIAQKLLRNLKMRWMVAFDQSDPSFITTGNLEHDLDHNIAAIAANLDSSIYPVYPVDRRGEPIAANMINASTFWAVDNLPRASVTEDSLFGATLQQMPADFYSLVKLQPRIPTKPAFSSQNLVYATSPQAPSQPLAPSPSQITPIFALDSTATRAALSVKQAVRLTEDLKNPGSLKNPRSRLMVSLYKAAIEPGSQDPSRFMWKMENNGSAKVKEILGDWTPPTWNMFKTIARWRGFTKSQEFNQAIGLGLVDPGIIREWLRWRFLSVDAVAHPQSPNTYKIHLTFDEDQLGLLFAVTFEISEQNWNLTINEPLSKEHLDNGRIAFDFSVTKDDASQADIDYLISSIKQIKRERNSQSPVENGRSRFVRVDFLDKPGSLKRVLEYFAKEGIEVTHIRRRTTAIAPHQYEIWISGPDGIDAPDPHRSMSIATALREMKDAVRHVDVALPDDLVNFQFKLTPYFSSESKQPEAFLLTETTDESQVGMLYEIVAAFTRCGWSLRTEPIDAEPHIFQGVTRDAGAEARWLLAPPVLRPGEDWESRAQELLDELGTIRRIREKNKEQSSPRRMDIHVAFKTISQNLESFLKEIATLDMNIHSIQLEMKNRGNKRWLDLEVSFHSAAEPTGETVKAALLEFKRADGQALFTPKDIEIIQDLNEATAIAAAKILQEEMAQNSVRYQKFLSWTRTKPTRLATPTDGEREDRRFLNELKGAIALAKLFHKTQRRDSDGAAYYYHLLEVTYTHLVHQGARDRVSILAAILHDSLEDGPKYCSLPAAEIEQMIRKSFPDISDKLITEIKALSWYQFQNYEGMMKYLSASGKINRIARKIADAEMNLMDFINDEAQNKTVAKFLAHLLGPLSWEPGFTSPIYAESHAQFLRAFYWELQKLNSSRWADIESRLDPIDFVAKVMNFSGWLNRTRVIFENSSPDSDPEFRRNLSGVLNELATRLLQRSAQRGLTAQSA